MTGSVTVSFGLDNSVTTSRYPEGSTVGTLVRDSWTKQALGFGDNVEAVINGVAMPECTPLAAGMIVTLRTKAGSKGAAKAKAKTPKALPKAKAKSKKSC